MKGSCLVGLANGGVSQEVFPPPAPPPTRRSPRNKSDGEEQVKVHRGVPELRALHLISLKQHWILKTLATDLQGFSPLQVY